MKNLIFTAFAFVLSISLMHAQEYTKENGGIAKPEKLNIKLKDGAEADIYVDGKKFDFPMDLLNKDKIASVSIIKGDKALKEYNSKNDVVLITTKNTTKENVSEVNSNSNSVTKNAPLIIIDGEKSDKEILKKITPDDIESIEVFKNEQALKKYNAPNGVIVVTTKDGKKK